MALDPDVLAAVRRYGPSINSFSESNYGISGTALLAKLVQGESGGRGNAVSPMGARGWAQFMPGSRQTAISKYGVDPWADPDQAVHAAVLHLQGKINGSKGLAGYNPGDPSYTNYILGQRVGNVLGGASPASSPGSTTQSAAGASSTPAAQGIIGSGSAGDVTGLLSSLLGSRERQAPAPMPLQAPSFAASPVMPQGFAPLTQTAQPAPEAESAVSQRLGLLDALRGEDPTSTAPAGPEAADGDSALPIAQTVANQRANGQAGSGRYPLGTIGKVIGTPNSGTHTLGNWQSDNAVDISVPEGTPMIALQDGVVVKVRHHPQDGGRFAGDQITIRGANGNEYFYAHGIANVRPGQRITRGQSLGVTGSANGVAHLHFGQLRGDPRDHV